MARSSVVRGNLLVFIVCIKILDTSCSEEFNSSAVTEVSEHMKNSDQPQVSLSISSKNGTGFRLKTIVRSAKALPSNDNWKDSDFQFVDSPDVTTAGTDAQRLPGHLNGSNERRTQDARGDVQNVWKSYPNGTIIHNVHVALVHPAQMGVLANEKLPETSAHGDNRTTMRENNTNSTLAGYYLSARDYNATIEDGNSTSSGNNFTSAGNNCTIDGNSSVVCPVTDDSTGNFSFAAPDRSNETTPGLKENLPPVINVGISIDTKGPCLSACLTKCATAVSLGGNPSKPICLPRKSSGPTIHPPLETSNESSSADNVTLREECTTSVPVLLLGDNREEFLDTTPGSSRSLSGPKLSQIEPLKFFLEEVCLSEKCVLKAADILKRMDKSADPCNSFYNFACGSYSKGEIPTGAPKSVFSDISSDNVARMYSALESPVASEDRLLVKILKRFYSKCILTTPNDLFLSIVRELGWQFSSSPPIRKNVWGEIAFNWTFGMFLEYNLISINLTYLNKTDKWMLNVDYPQFVKEALVSNSLNGLSETERDLKIVASAIGMDNSTVKSVLSDLRIFMFSAIRYAKATMVDAENGEFSLKVLRAIFTHIDVFKELPSLLKSAVAIDDNVMIRVSNMGYLRKINELLRDSTVRTQANHLVLNALRILSVMIGTSDDNSKERYCVKLTGKLFPSLVGHLHSTMFISDSQVVSASKMVTRVQSSLLDWLNASVSDQALKKKAIDKVKKLEFTWNNRKELSDELTSIVRSFDENSSLVNFVKTGIRNFKQSTYAYLNNRGNNSLASFVERYSGDGYGVNAYYYSDHISIPPSALHPSIFDAEVPPYVSFGGLGLIVAHEMIHSVVAIDDLVNSKSYVNMQKCLVRRFNSFPKGVNVNATGDSMIEDNIADYGGFTVAYRAFLEWYKKSSKESKEKRLPGLQTFNEKQMFWLTAAANWCRKIPPGFVDSSDKHAPPEYRVDGQFANIPEFAEDFNCPVDSPMNPKLKCSLW